MKPFLICGPVLGALVAAACTSVSVAGDSPVPGETGGLLDLDALIALALRNSPEIQQLHGDIATTHAEEKAASDWRDPELRVSYGREHDVELPPPETESRRIRGTETTRENRSEFERDNVTGTETRSTRNGTTTTRTDELETIRTIPGATSDQIISETSEVTTETTQFSDRSTETNSRVGLRSIGSEDVSQRTSERTTARSVENRRYDFDRTDPDSDLEFSLRLRPPNPWEVRAKKDQARTLREKYRSLVHAAQFDIIADVREAYADAQQVAAELSAARKLVSSYQQLVTELNAVSASSDPATEGIGDSLDDLLKFEADVAQDLDRREDDIADAEGDVFVAEAQVADLELEVADARAELATIAGLSDPARISLGSRLMPAGIDIGSLDREFLYSVAEGWREDILELVYDAKITGAELREYNAQKIPWFTLLEGYYEVNNDRGRRSSDGYGVQVGISIPIFSWLSNNEDDVYRREIESYELQAAALRRRIRGEIDSTLRHLENTRKRLGDYESRYASYRAKLRKRITDSKNFASRALAIRFRAEENLAKLDEQDADIRAREIDALLRLERAIGAEFRMVLGRAASAQPKQPDGPAPALAPIP